MFFKKIMFSFLIICFLGGCSGQPAESEVTSENELSTSAEKEETALSIPRFPKEFKEKVSDRLIFDAAVFVNEGIEKNLSSSYTAKILSLNPEKIENIISKKISLVSEEEYECPLGQDKVGIEKRLEGANGEIVTINDYQFQYFNEAWNYTRNAFHPSSKDGLFNLEQFKEESVFSFGTNQVVYEEIKKMMEEMDISISSQYRSVSLGHDVLEGEEQSFLKQMEAEGVRGKPDWSEADSGYYFAIDQLVDAIPVYQIRYYGKGVEGDLDTSKILAFYNGKGLSMMETGPLLDVMKKEEEWELISLEEIVEALKNRFELLLTDYPVTITELKLAYIATFTDTTNLVLEPVWLCNGWEETEQGKKAVQVILDGATGEEKVYDME